MLTLHYIIMILCLYIHCHNRWVMQNMMQIYLQRVYCLGNLYPNEVNFLVIKSIWTNIILTITIAIYHNATQVWTITVSSATGKILFLGDINIRPGTERATLTTCDPHVAKELCNLQVKCDKLWSFLYQSSGHIRHTSWHGRLADAYSSAHRCLERAWCVESQSSQHLHLWADGSRSLCASTESLRYRKLSWYSHVFAPVEKIIMN